MTGAGDTALSRLAGIVAEEGLAVDRNDWRAFDALQREAQILLQGLGPLSLAESGASRQLLAELEGVLRRLATKHEITGQLLRYLGSRQGERPGRAIDTTY